jgi:hypothetical protein
MSVSLKNVHVGYRFSIDPCSSPHSHLSKPIHLIELVAAAKKAARNTQSRKPFIVELKNFDTGKRDTKKGREKTKGRKKVCFMMYAH